MGLTSATELAEEILRTKAEKRVGTTLREKWHLDSLIGVGGMAAVYEATHRNGMRGAVKVLHSERAADETIKSRFLREGYIANKVDHAGAVRVLDDDEADGSVFLVMELLEGATLEQAALRQGGALPPKEMMIAIDQVLQTLSAAHDKGIVHRDLKPENLFLTDSGVVKILDYGIAGLRETSSESRTATQTGHAMGTPAYMSPEQARGRWNDVDARSDLWSVGATMFWLLSGTTVHDEGTVPELVAATFLTPARSMQSVAPEVPSALAAVVDRALLLDKEKRWQDASAMREALRAAYAEIQGKPMPAPPSVDRPPTPLSMMPVTSRTVDEVLAVPVQRPSRRGVVFAGAALVFIVVVAAFAVGIRSPSAAVPSGPVVQSAAVPPSILVAAPTTDAPSVSSQPAALSPLPLSVPVSAAAPSAHAAIPRASSAPVPPPRVIALTAPALAPSASPSARKKILESAD
jgi:serine/threonine protein kinase